MRVITADTRGAGESCKGAGQRPAVARKSADAKPCYATPNRNGHGQ